MPAEPVDGFDVRLDGDSVVRVTGDIDFVTAPMLGIALASLVRRERVVVVDLAGVDYMSAAGIDVLETAVQAIGGQGRIVLRNPQPIVRRLVQLTHLDRSVEIVDHQSTSRRQQRLIDCADHRRTEVTRLTANGGVTRLTPAGIAIPPR